MKVNGQEGTIGEYVEKGDEHVIFIRKASGQPENIPVQDVPKLMSWGSGEIHDAGVMRGKQWLETNTCDFTIEVRKWEIGQEVVNPAMTDNAKGRISKMLDKYTCVVMGDNGVAQPQAKFAELEPVLQNVTDGFGSRGWRNPNRFMNRRKSNMGALGRADTRPHRTNSFS